MEHQSKQFLLIFAVVVALLALLFVFYKIHRGETISIPANISISADDVNIQSTTYSFVHKCERNTEISNIDCENLVSQEHCMQKNFPDCDKRLTREKCLTKNGLLKAVVKQKCDCEILKNDMEYNATFEQEATFNFNPPESDCSDWCYTECKNVADKL